jgi:hypothetical protein
VIEALTTGRMIPSRELIFHQQRYRPSDSNTDYGAMIPSRELIFHQQRYRPSDSNTDYWADDTIERTSLDGIIRPIVSVTITGSIPLLMEY